MPDRSRLQVRTTNNPDKFEFVGPDSAGVQLPVDATITASDLPINPDDFSLNHYDTTTTANVIYIGSERSNTDWMVEKLNTSTKVLVYATVSNNSSYTTYDTAWADRASLTYESYGDVF